MCNDKIYDFSSYGRIRRYVTNREVCDDCYIEVVKFVNNAHNNHPNNSDAADRAAKCVHPKGYIKSVRVCGLCGKQL